MIPGIVNQNLPSPFKPPKNILTNMRTSLHTGGVGLGDLSKGREYQTWKLMVSDDAGSLVLSSVNYPETVVITDISIEECSLAFDQNLNPVYAWVALGVSKYRWFDTRVNDFVVTILNGRSPYVVMDDTCDVTVGISDVILSYFLGNSLYYRVQREFYETPHLVATYSENGRILRAGMQENLRFSWEVIPFS